MQNLLMPELAMLKSTLDWLVYTNCRRDIDSAAIEYLKAQTTLRYWQRWMTILLKYYRQSNIVCQMWTVTPLLFLTLESLTGFSIQVVTIFSLYIFIPLSLSHFGILEILAIAMFETIDVKHNRFRENLCSSCRFKKLKLKLYFWAVKLHKFQWI